jgi:hypothetical protein
MPGKKRAQNPLVSAKIGTICTYAALPEGSGTVSAHLRRQHKPTVVRCKPEVGMGRASWHAVLSDPGESVIDMFQNFDADMAFAD